MDEKDIKKEEKNETSTLKERMQKVINASKKLDDDLTAEDPKKAAMKEKLAKASKDFEDENLNTIDNEKAEMSDEEILEKRKAEYYAKKNEDKKKQLEEMRAKLNAVMNENLGEAEKEDAVIIDNVKEDKEEAIEEQDVNVALEEQSKPAEELVDEIEDAKASEDVSNSNKVETSKEDNKDIEVSSAIVSDIVKEYRNEEKVEIKEEKEDYSEITKDIKEELPELKEEKVKNKNHIGKKILDFVIKTMNGMAHGLFATLIVGTIIICHKRHYIRIKGKIVNINNFYNCSNWICVACVHMKGKYNISMVNNKFIYCY